MVLPVQASCWPMRLERWTLPGSQRELLAWPGLVLQRQALQQLVWRLALQQQVLQLA